MCGTLPVYKVHDLAPHCKESLRCSLICSNMLILMQEVGALSSSNILMEKNSYATSLVI